ncbi:MAG: hypothetical protein IKN27_14655, partial [Selenomonadaceae bacterium]|nr:hypothetical protein [Selenomonadaceae bacterium]
GDSIGALWKNLFGEGIHIDFAHRTFKWLSDSENMAHVHCVIVAFSKAPNPNSKKIFDGDNFTIATNINAYLVNGENIFIESRNKPLFSVPKMIYGNKPADGGNLIIEADDLDVFLRDEPAAEKFIHPLLGADEFINGKKRYCLWLVDVPDKTWRKFPLVAEHVEAVKNFRLSSIAAGIRKFAAKPSIFAQVTQPEGVDFILVPRVSSERRRYIPIDFVGKEVKVTDAVQIIPDAQIYHFGILTSSIHMAWTRATCGRLESRYRYSAQIVYNNFPWPTPSNSQRRLIEESAQKILDVRKNFSSRTFASLYDENTMPDELRSAHKWNDYNVALAYGFEKFLDDEPKIVSELMKLYKRLTS